MSEQEKYLIVEAALTYFKNNKPTEADKQFLFPKYYLRPGSFAFTQKGKTMMFLGRVLTEEMERLSGNETTN